jgi:hypothetical protein
MENASLANFAPLIQLISGIYLLFIYDRTFKRNPLEFYQDELIDLLNRFVNQFIGNLSEEQMETAGNHIKKEKHIWDNCALIIQRISLLSFLFCLFLLAFIGYEGNNVKSINYERLMFMSMFFLFYIFLLFVTFPFQNIFTQFIRKYIIIVLYFLLLIIGFHFYEGIIYPLNLPLHSIINYILLTSLMGIFIWILLVCILFFGTIYSQNQIKSLNDNFNHLVTAIISVNFPSTFPKKLKQKLEQKLNQKSKKKITALLNGSSSNENGIEFHKADLDESMYHIINEQFNNFFLKESIFIKMYHKLYPPK